jgi:hypothetical protein
MWMSWQNCDGSSRTSWTPSKYVFSVVLFISDTEELSMCAQVSALVRLELNSLKNQHDMSAVLTLATRMIEDQKLRHYGSQFQSI